MTETERDRTTGASAEATRRAVLRGVAVGGAALPLLTACGGGDSASGGTPAPGPGAGGGAADLAAADIPVGGGAILAEQQVVVTQPAAGDFKAFSAVCTHQGCVVSTVEDRQIVCGCHGSHFSIEDGSPVSGPARSALAPKKVSVQGGRISVG